MSSQLNVDTIVDKAGSGGSNVKMANTSTYVGEGGSGTQNTVQGLCKAWCYFDGTAGTISFSDSFNGSSLTDVATGQYDISFSSSMANSTYPCNMSDADRNDNQATFPNDGASCRMYNRMGIDGSTPSDNDASQAQFTAHGDLA